MQYIEGDPFGGLRRRHHELVNIWVQKEHRNMMRMSYHGLRVPEPHALFRMCWLSSGDEDGTGLHDCDAEIGRSGPAIRRTAKLVAWDCWQKAELVHADFSEYNTVGIKVNLVSSMLVNR